MDKPTLSVQEAALVLHKSMDTITRYCKKGILFAQEVSYGSKKTYVIPRQSILIYMQDQIQKQELEKRQRLQVVPQQPKTEEHGGYLNRFRKALESGLLENKVYSQRTVDDYIYYLEQYFAKYEVIFPDHLETELIAMAHTKAKKVHYYKAVACFTRYLVQKKVVSEELLKEIKKLRPPENKNPKRHVVRLNEMVLLESACQTKLELLILRLLAYTGIRVSEACNLNWEDIDWEGARLVIWKGKGDKSRNVSIPTKAMEVLYSYRESVKPAIGEMPIFLNRDGNRMTPRGMHDRLDALGKRVGIKTHPHALRRAFVTISAHHGIPVVALQHQCGHVHLSTTTKYLRSTEDEVLEITRSINW
ncbi:MAG TPA: tyrosine-type recombinase/integrase [Oculatellaceae cyanobacterium]